MKLKMTESELRKRVKNMLKEELSEFQLDPQKEAMMEFEGYYENGNNCFETPDGNVVYFEYKPKENMLIAGGATNAGIIPEIQMPYDLDDSVQANLENLYDMVMSRYSMEESKKTVKKLTEADLKQIIKESIDEVMAEGEWTDSLKNLGSAAKQFGKATLNKGKEFGQKVADKAVEIGDKVSANIQQSDCERRFLYILTVNNIDFPNLITHPEKLEDLKKQYPKAWAYAYKMTYGEEP